MAHPIVEMLLQCPADSRMMEPSLIGDIKKWSDPPKAIEVLETLDKIVHCGLCTPMIHMLYETLLEEQMKSEGTTLAELTKLATWRDKNKSRLTNDATDKQEVCG